MASPHTTRLTGAVQALVDASVSRDASAVREALAAIEHRVRDVTRRAGVSQHAAVAVFVRDCWTCRYCGGRTIPQPVLRVLSRLYPDEFPYHPNWKAGQVHPAYLLISTSLDHVVPGARGGSWTDPDNLVTACWPCNSGKADFAIEEIGWMLLTEHEVRTEWDGLTGSYRALWELAGGPDADYHRRWLRAIALAGR